jgi:hypothetical protein
MSIKRIRLLDNILVFTEHEKRLKDTPFVSFFMLPLRAQKSDKSILSYILINLRAQERTKTKLRVFPEKP